MCLWPIWPSWSNKSFLHPLSWIEIRIPSQPLQSPVQTSLKSARAGICNDCVHITVPYPVLYLEKKKKVTIVQYIVLEVTKNLPT